MTTDSERDVTRLPAGDFARWIGEMSAALRGDRDADVPCDGCTACCTSSQFVHVGPDEGDALAHIPRDLQFPAPGLPDGHVVLGYDQRGHCPMLVDGRCSIYAHRPRACRTYDCRVFPASGVVIDDEAKVTIRRRAERWEFGFPTDEDHARHDAALAAARYVQDHAASLPDEIAPTSSTQRAVLAIELHEAFLEHDSEGRPTAVVDPESEALRVEIVQRLRDRRANTG